MCHLFASDELREHPLTMRQRTQKAWYGLRGWIALFPSFLNLIKVKTGCRCHLSSDCIRLHGWLDVGFPICRIKLGTTTYMSACPGLDPSCRDADWFSQHEGIVQ